jgi:AraC family transcriptional regulator, positive regulator of tynA and feaB
LPVWDISEQPIRDQFGYWHDVICDVFIPMTPKRSVPGVGFASGVEARPLGEINRTDVWSQAQQTLHGPREVARSDGEFYFVNLMVAGRCLVRQGDRESIASTGQLWVVDTSVPYFLDFDSPWRMFTFRVPHRLLSMRLLHPGQGTATPLDGGSGVGGLAATMMRSMWDLDEPDSVHTRAELEQSFASVVSAALGTRGGDERAQDAVRDALRADVLRFVAANLADPGLSIAAVCRRFAISPRLLHRLFEEHEHTFAQTVRTMRLERCARLLADPLDRSTVTDIALRHGFTDSASFSRAFRRHFGIAPREMRERGRRRIISSPSGYSGGTERSSTMRPSFHCAVVL